MNAVVILDWKFSPRDYFEEAIEISREDYTMTIADGEVKATIDSAIYAADSRMRQRLHDELEGRFLGVQLHSHRAYELSRSTMTRVHPDGRRDISVELEGERIVVSAGTLDFQVTDKDGNVISDSKRQRIERQKALGELVSRHTTDALLASMLRSFTAAVKDPNNELVHLYEIREALSAKRRALRISRNQWERLGRLCDDPSIRQGRHRGKSLGPLRDATEGELTEARTITRNMIEAYLQNLEASTSQ